MNVKGHGIKNPFLGFVLLFDPWNSSREYKLKSVQFCADYQRDYFVSSGMISIFCS